MTHPTPPTPPFRGGVGGGRRGFWTGLLAGAWVLFFLDKFGGFPACGAVIFSVQKVKERLQPEAPVKKIKPAEAARLLGVTRQSVHKRMQSLGITRNDDGTYDSSDVARAIALTVDVESDAKSLSVEIKREQLRRARLQSELLELEIAKQRGEVITRSEHRALLRQLQELCMRLIDTWIELLSTRRRDASLEQDMYAAREDALRKLGLLDTDNAQSKKNNLR